VKRLRSIPPATAEVGRDEQRCLLIAPHFPPGTGAGALRWEKLCGHLASAGWALDVVTMDPAVLPSRDEARLAALPAGTRVFAVAPTGAWIDPLEQAAWRAVRGLRAARAALRKEEAMPAGAPAGAPVRTTRESYASAELRWRASPDDARRAFHAYAALARDRAWARAAANGATRELDRGLYRAVITSGPPHMVHLAGATLARRWGVPHVVDMRDPWSLVERLPAAHASPITVLVARHHERRLIRAAAAVITNTDAHGVALGRVYPRARQRITTVMNGCDEDAPPPAPPTRRFLIAYTGTIYLDRNPRPLFEAAGRVVRAASLSPDEFGIELMGTVHSLDGVSIADVARDAGLGEYVRLRPPAPRREALEFMAHAAMLVDLPQDSTMAIPSKVFEYMSFPAWILAMAERDTATELLLRDTPADVVRPGDVEAIERVLRRRLEEFRGGVRPAPISADGRFSRRAQAGRLLAVLEDLAAAPVQETATAEGRRAAASSASRSSVVAR